MVMNKLNFIDDNIGAGGTIRWDAWNRPYQCPYNRHFVLFDTGEFAIMNADVPVDNRILYKELGLSLCVSGEINERDNAGASHTETPDGGKVAKAHLIFDLFGATKQQLFIVDHERREIFSGGNQSYNRCTADNTIADNTIKKSVPEEIAKRCTVYYSAHYNRPVSPPIRIVRPLKLDKEQKERVSLAETLIASACSLKGLTNTAHHRNEYRYEVARELFINTLPVPQIVSQFTSNELMLFRQNGIPKKEILEVPYLKF